MAMVPIRCGRCGSLSMGGLLIPESSLRSGALGAPPPQSAEPGSCPLCKAQFSSASQQLSSDLYRELLSRSGDVELSALAVLLKDHLERRSTHAEVAADVEQKTPKFTGLMRFIPSADVTGALALIIAILAFADDIVVNWFLTPAATKQTDDPSSGPQLFRRKPTIEVWSHLAPCSPYTGGAAYYLIGGNWSASDDEHLFICRKGARTGHVNADYYPNTRDRWSHRISYIIGERGDDRKFAIFSATESEYERLYEGNDDPDVARIARSGGIAIRVHPESPKPIERGATILSRIISFKEFKARD